MSETQLSRAAYDRLRAELYERIGPRRREIADMIERARELGDLKENGDYHAAKNEQGLNESRVRQLESLLKKAEIIDDLPSDMVTQGMVVEISIAGGPSMTYLFGSIEERSEHDPLSPTSPLGKVLAGRSPGDRVEYEAPRGMLMVEIVSVRPAD